MFESLPCFSFTFYEKTIFNAEERVMGTVNWEFLMGEISPDTCCTMIKAQTMDSISLNVMENKTNIFDVLWKLRMVEKEVNE